MITSTELPYPFIQVNKIDMSKKKQKSIFQFLQNTNEIKPSLEEKTDEPNIKPESSNVCTSSKNTSSDIHIKNVCDRSGRVHLPFLDVRNLSKPNQPTDFSFPIRIQSGKGRSFQSSWFKTFDWLHYDEEMILPSALHA